MPFLRISFSILLIQSMKPLIIAMIALLPATALGEGALRELVCSYHRACDADGACKDEKGQIIFTMEPETVADDGSGSFIIHYGGRQAPMRAMGFAGPFTWKTPVAVSTLMASSEEQFLWHRLALSPEPTADIHFMNCRFTQ